MILDSLTHVTPDGRWFNGSLDASESALLRELDAARVERAVVVALAGHISNEFVGEVCERHSTRLIAGASFDPSAWGDPAAAAAAAESELRDAPFPLVKLHPRLNRYDPLDPRCLAVLEEFASWETPPKVWIDSLLHFAGGTLRKPLVATFYELINRFPALTFVILHGGGANLLPLAEAIRGSENAYLDLSFSLVRYHGSSVDLDMAYLLRTFDRRIVFGSDFPEITPREALLTFDRMSSGLAPAKRANVLGANLARILSGG